MTDRGSFGQYDLTRYHAMPWRFLGYTGMDWF